MVEIRFLFSATQMQSGKGQGRVVRKPVNANLGFQVNQRINFSCLKMFFTAYVLGSVRLFKLKTQG